MPTKVTDVTQLFKKNKPGNALPITNTQLAFESLTSALRGAAPIGEAITVTALSLEGYNSIQESDLDQTVSSLKTTLSNVLGKESAKYNFAQEAAALGGAVLSGAPLRALSSRVATFEQLKGSAPEGTVVVGHHGMPDVIEKRPVSLEAFDNRENRNVAAYGMMYNLQAARQDEFGEAFFPTVTITPDNLGFMTSIKLIYVYDEVKRNVNGALDQFNRRNVLRALVDPSILRDDQTKVIPIYRTGTPATDSSQNFATGIAAYDIEIDKKTQQTAPLAFGKKFSLLGISQTDAILAAGQMDQTDALDPSIRLGAFYIRFGTAGSYFYVKVDASKLPFSEFNAAPQGNTKLMQLNFSNDTILIKSGMKDVTGATIAALDTALTTNEVQLSVGISGKIVLDTSDTEMMAFPVSINKVTTAEGVVLSTASGAGATIKTLMDTAVLVGYDLLAQRTNSNRRNRGQLIDTQVINQLYTVPLRSPISALRPVMDSDANDSSTIASLVTTTYARISNEAVRTLLEARDFLKAFVPNAQSVTETPEYLGVARHLVKAAFIEEPLNVLEKIDSLKSSDRADDVQALLVNKLRDIAARLYNNSYMKIAADSVYEGQAPKPVVIIGTDPYIARYLQVNGDLRTLGDLFECKIVTTQNLNVAGKIFIAFGMNESWTSGTPNPLHFGNMAWKPEIVVAAPSWREGITAMEMTVTPCFRHIINTPVLGVVEVTGIEDIIADKATVNMATVTP